MDESTFRVDSEHDPILPTRAPRTKQNNHKIRWIILIVIVIGLAAGLALFLTRAKPHKQTGKITNQTITTTPVTTTSTLNQYVSNGTDLNLSFNYPNNWKITPPTNTNTTDKPITLTSPLISVTDADGVSDSAEIVIQVRPATTTLSELNTNSPTTAIASSQIAYSKPTKNQTTYPYLTYIHFVTGSKVAGSFEEVLITGEQSLASGQSISSQDFSGLDPIITASFFKCTNQTCTTTGQSPLSTTMTGWQNDLIFQQVLSVLQSFQLN